MKLLLPAALLVGSIQSAMQQPLFPGKIVAWLLCVLSIISWVLIVSKALHLSRTRKADKRFGERLRASRTTLEVFEEGWRDENSLQLLIYYAGARETAFQLLGSRNPGEGAAERIGAAGRMDGTQREFLESAFEAGYRRAERKLVSGTGVLRVVGAAAAMLGLLGGVWTLMEGFDNAGDSGLPPATIGAALGFVAIALLVAIPAVTARIAFSIILEPRRYELAKFREDILRLFLRKFGQAPEPRRRTVRDSREGERESEHESPEDPTGEETGGKKRYHSIRDRLLDPMPDNELEINPIAQQAASLKPRS